MLRHLSVSPAERFHADLEDRLSNYMELRVKRSVKRDVQTKNIKLGADGKPIYMAVGSLKLLMNRLQGWVSL